MDFHILVFGFYVCLSYQIYSDFLGIPVAGATLPVIAFLLLSVYGRNFFLLFAVVILRVGHMGIHLMHKMRFRLESVIGSLVCILYVIKWIR